MKILWSDKSRIFGMPITFTRYKVDRDRLYFERGLLTLRKDEIRLYRVKDISTVQTLAQRIFGCGTVTLHSDDTNLPVLRLESIKDPDRVKELLSNLVDESRRRNNVRTGEMLDAQNVII